MLTTKIKCKINRFIILWKEYRINSHYVVCKWMFIVCCEIFYFVGNVINIVAISVISVYQYINIYMWSRSAVIIEKVIKIL